MTIAPLPCFLPADALNEFERFDGSLIYLRRLWGIRTLLSGRGGLKVSTGTVDT